MKNVVLIDFTNESIEALNYAVGFSEAMNGELEILNVSDKPHELMAEKHLASLKKEYSSESLKINIIKLTGNIDQAIKSYINTHDIGFVFSGTHELELIEQFFSSRALHLLNEVKANFLFVPHNLKSYQKVSNVFLPILEDKKSLQNIEELRYLHQFMDFEVTIGTYESTNNDLKQNLIVASKLLSKVGIKYSLLTLGTTESSFKNELNELEKIGETDLISLVNLTEENLFNSNEKGFVEDLIRNKEGLPVLVIQNQNISEYGGFQAMGG